ncbi:lipocalin-like domain-containing protein [Lysobacter sp. K5869]|uniref:lipocalin-like domain-containing protein n=1 Tax=Lysobacter sp. K5869 TaxID=2820808 RepID=UPI001C05FB5F|nr:lipocalin-like domain-containing protein [Lysobacter sp. K5869]QWP75399.1 lipocalin-like domain-containing protein [Lysobacter sp. K5869]
MNRLIVTAFATLAGLAASDISAQEATASPLQGAWTLVAADKILPGGERARDYGEHPKGRLLIDARGRYTLQIFKSERPRFASADKAAGSAEEFKAATLGGSTHYGTLKVDRAGKRLVFAIEGASFPNWEGTVQERAYELVGDELSYRVPARPDGSVPVSVWRRID